MLFLFFPSSSRTAARSLPSISFDSQFRPSSSIDSNRRAYTASPSHRRSSKKRQWHNLSDAFRQWCDGFQRLPSAVAIVLILQRTQLAQPQPQASVSDASPSQCDLLSAITATNDYFLSFNKVSSDTNFDILKSNTPF